jgi:hypothetical protein
MGALVEFLMAILRDRRRSSCSIKLTSSVPPGYSVPYADMILFDDNKRHITVAQRNGMTGMLVSKGEDWRGLSGKVLEEGLQKFGQARGSK